MAMIQSSVADSNEHQPVPYHLVAATGLLGGVIGLCYMAVLEQLERILGPQEYSPYVHLVVLGVIGFLVWILECFLGTPGDVELLVDNIHIRGGSRGMRELRSLLPISLLCIAAGGAAGPEAPLVQTTGSLGTRIAERYGLSRSQMRVLTIAGMAAGFSVLFGAPLGAAVFALEILHRRGLEYYEALLPAVIGALIGYAIFVVGRAVPLQPIWHFPEPSSLVPVDLGWAVMAGGIGAVIARLFVATVEYSRAFFRKLPSPLRLVAGGLMLGGLGWWTPYALTFGEAQVDSVIGTTVGFGLLIAATGKLLGTSITISSGWRGGFIIPLFFVGACLGRVGHQLFPGVDEGVLMAGLMAAINTGVTKTPLGSTLVVTSMAGLHLIPTTLIAAVVALLLSGRINLISSQRPREASQEEVLPAGAIPAMSSLE